MKSCYIEKIKSATALHWIAISVFVITVSLFGSCKDTIIFWIRAFIDNVNIIWLFCKDHICKWLSKFFLNMIGYDILSAKKSTYHLLIFHRYYCWHDRTIFIIMLNVFNTLVAAYKRIQIFPPAVCLLE